MAKTEHILLTAGVLGLGYLFLKGGVTLPGGNVPSPDNGANPPGWDETEGGTRSNITPQEFASWEERQQYFLNMPEDQRPLSYFTGQPIDPTQPAGSPANPLSPLVPFGPIISWESWYDIRNVQATGISKEEFVAKAKGWHLGYTLELIRTRGSGGAVQIFDSDFQDYFGADWRLWQQALGYGGTGNAKFDDAGNYMPDGATVYPFPIDNSGYQAWINAGNFGGYYDWLATGKDAGYAVYKASNPLGMNYYDWQVLNRPDYTVYRKPDGSYTDYWNGQYYTAWLETDNPLLGGAGGSGGGGGGVVAPPIEPTPIVPPLPVEPPPIPPQPANYTYWQNGALWFVPYAWDGSVWKLNWSAAWYEVEEVVIPPQPSPYRSYNNNGYDVIPFHWTGDRWDLDYANMWREELEDLLTGPTTPKPAPVYADLAGVWVDWIWDEQFKMWRLDPSYDWVWG